MAQFFQAHVAIDLQLNEEGLERYAHLSQAGFADNKYVLLQTALAQYHARGISVLLRRLLSIFHFTLVVPTTAIENISRNYGVENLLMTM